MSYLTAIPRIQLTMVFYMCSILFQWTLDSRDLSEFMLLQAEQIPKMTTVFTQGPG